MAKGFMWWHPLQSSFVIHRGLVSEIPSLQITKIHGWSRPLYKSGGRQSAPHIQCWLNWQKWNPWIQRLTTRVHLYDCSLGLMFGRFVLGVTLAAVCSFWLLEWTPQFILLMMACFLLGPIAVSFAECIYRFLMDVYENVESLPVFHLETV